MQVHAIVFEHLSADAELRRMRPQIRARGARGFLHHFADLPGDRKTTTARQQRRFDEKDLTAHLCPGHARSHAGG